MQILGQVVTVEMDIEIEKQAGGSYQGARLTYRADGKIQEQAFHNNVLKFNPKIKNILSELKSGETITITKDKKEGEKFWNVTSIVRGVAEYDTPKVAGATSSPSTTASPRSTYETPEERAKKQVYIVRQSSITAAIALKGSKASVEEIIATAKQFEAHVFGQEFDDGSIDTIQNSDLDVE